VLHGGVKARKPYFFDLAMTSKTGLEDATALCLEAENSGWLCSFVGKNCQGFQIRLVLGSINCDCKIIM
jgi:hypothetical protein